MYGLAAGGDYVWAATGGGAVCWNRANGTYVKYIEPDGLSRNDVHAVAIDQGGRKW